MKKLASFVILSMLLAVAAYAIGPVQNASTLTSTGSTDPLLSPGVDVVAWATVGTAPSVFGRSGGGKIGNFVYEFGSEGFNTAQAFNLTTNAWVASTPATVGYDNWASITTASAVYLIGGYTGTTAINNCQRFTPTAGGPTGTWAQMAVYPLAVYGPTAAWDGNDLIYVASGNTMAGYSLTAYKYSISGNTWSALANPPVSQSFSGSAFVGGKFYVFGGTDAAGLGTRNYAYDPVTNTWAVRASAPTAVWFATSSTTSNGTHMMSVGGGGGYASWPGTNAVQIYDPATNSWAAETSLPVARGCNQATWLGSGEVLSGGGYAGGYSGVTYRGTGFFAAPANVTIDMSPVTTPIVIPPGGGSFDFNATITNGETTSQTFAVWIMVQLPNMTWYGPALGPVTVTLGPSATLTRLRTQSVPASAPAGAYVYEGRVGSYPSTIWNSDSFPFSKSAVGDGGSYVGEWTNTGQSFDASSPVAPSNYILHGASPNPFNPTTTLSFVLPQAGQVKLSVFNVAGRQVAELVNGYRAAGSHEVTFDASNLASGLYLYQLSAGDFNATGKMMLMK